MDDDDADDDDGSNDHKDDQHIGNDVGDYNVIRILFDSIASMQDQPSCWCAMNYLMWMPCPGSWTVGVEYMRYMYIFNKLYNMKK